MPGVSDDMNDIKDDFKLKNPNTTNYAIVVAQMMLGTAYAQGNDEVKQDRTKAKELMNKAKENGFVHADDYMKALGLD
jgi:TPR repeat protein